MPIQLGHPAVPVALMFHLTCSGWLLFRARSPAQIGEMSASLVTGWGRPAPDAAAWAGQLAFYVVPLLAVHLWEAARDDRLAVFRLPVALRYSVYVGLFYLTLLFGEFGGAQVIYFQF